MTTNQHPHPDLAYNFSNLQARVVSLETLHRDLTDAVMHLNTRITRLLLHDNRDNPAERTAEATDGL